MEERREKKPIRRFNVQTSGYQRRNSKSSPATYLTPEEWGSRLRKPF